MKLGRYLFNPQYRTFLKWQATRGDETLRYDYNIARTDVIFDVGAFKGEFSKKIIDRFPCIIHAFEPIDVFADEARVMLKGHPDVQVHQFGLSSAHATAEISIAGLGSSRNMKSSVSVVAEFYDVVDVMCRLAPSGVTLMKINIEGDEYALLDRIIDSGNIECIRYLQVQFHLFKLLDRIRYRRLAKKLEQSHVLVWRFPFIWESWEEKNHFLSRQACSTND